MRVLTLVMSIILLVLLTSCDKDKLLFDHKTNTTISNCEDIKYYMSKFINKNDITMIEYIEKPSLESSLICTYANLKYNTANKSELIFSDISNFLLDEIKNYNSDPKSLELYNIANNLYYFSKIIKIYNLELNGNEKELHIQAVKNILDRLNTEHDANTVYFADVLLKLICYGKTVGFESVLYDTANKFVNNNINPNLIDDEKNTYALYEACIEKLFFNRINNEKALLHLKTLQKKI